MSLITSSLRAKGNCLPCHGKKPANNLHSTWEYQAMPPSANNRRIKIFIAHHKPHPTLANEIYQPLHVGKELSTLQLDMPADNTGDHISSKNDRYCELTALYWVWKNVDADYVGLCHYRRYFIFEKERLFRNILKRDTKKKGAIQIPLRIISDRNILPKRDVPINPMKRIKRMVARYDLILPEVASLGESLEQDYLINHNPEPWYRAIEITTHLYPQSRDIIDQVIHNNHFYAYNMFVMKQQLFHEYMSWLFPVVFELEKTCAIPEDAYQKRCIGFISERLFNIYCAIIRGRDHLRIKEIPVVFFDTHGEALISQYLE